MWRWIRGWASRFLALASWSRLQGMQFRATHPYLGKGLTCALVMAFGVGAFLLGRAMHVSPVQGQTPTLAQPTSTASASHLYPEDYSGRVVAYIFNNIPVTRVDLAEHLIARFGSERLEFLVNRKIIEKKCQELNVHVSDAEVEDQFRRDLLAFGPHMTAKLFQEQILSRYKKSVFEWKEDVIRPKLALAKLVRPHVVVSDQDLLQRFEVLHGPKVQCRMIVYQDKHKATRSWEKFGFASDLETAFITEAKQQYIPNLAAVGGTVPPIHKHFGDVRIEKEAFRLKVGEISQVLEMPDNTAIILFCERHLAADPLKRFDAERPNLTKEMFAVKEGEKIAEYVHDLRKQANPRLLLARQPNIDQVERETESILNGQDPNFRPIGGTK